MSRGRFGAAASVVAAVLLAAGAVLADRDGFAGLLGLLCIAWGLGIGVAAAFILLGRNPMG